MSASIVEVGRPEARRCRVSLVRGRDYIGVVGVVGVLVYDCSNSDQCIVVVIWQCVYIWQQQCVSVWQQQWLVYSSNIYIYIYMLAVVRQRMLVVANIYVNNIQCYCRYTYECIVVVIYIVVQQYSSSSSIAAVIVVVVIICVWQYIKNIKIYNIYYTIQYIQNSVTTLLCAGSSLNTRQPITASLSNIAANCNTLSETLIRLLLTLVVVVVDRWAQLWRYTSY